MAAYPDNNRRCQWEEAVSVAHAFLTDFERGDLRAGSGPVVDRVLGLAFSPGPDGGTCAAWATVEAALAEARAAGEAGNH